MAHDSLRSFRINIYIPNVLTALSNRTFMVTYKLVFSTQTNLKDYILLHKQDMTISDDEKAYSNTVML